MAHIESQPQGTRLWTPPTTLKGFLLVDEADRGSGGAVRDRARSGCERARRCAAPAVARPRSEASPDTETQGALKGSPWRAESMRMTQKDQTPDHSPREQVCERGFVLVDERSSVVLARVSTQAEATARRATLRAKGRRPLICALG